MRASFIAFGAIVCVACVGQTGGDSIVFPAAAAGPADAVAGQPLTFVSGAFDIVLSQATLHVGAIYLDQTAPYRANKRRGAT